MQASSQLVTMLNWAMSPHVKRMNMAFVLIDEQQTDLSDRLTGNPHVAAIEVPLPDQPARQAFIEATTAGSPLTEFSDFGAAELGTLTAGISLTDLNVLVQSAQPESTFNEAAIEAVSQWQFEPVIENGAPVEKRTAVRMAFELQE